jgi:hypothetical protein
LRDLELTFEIGEFRVVETLSEFPRGRDGEGGNGGGLLPGTLLGLPGVLPSLLIRRGRGGGIGGSFFSLAARSILMIVLLTMFGGTTLLAVSVIVGEETLDFAMLIGEFSCPGMNVKFSHSTAFASYSFWTFSRISNKSAQVGLSSGFSLQHNCITTKDKSEK